LNKVILILLLFRQHSSNQIAWFTFSPQYEWNARTQVTMWFDTNETTQSKLHDYGKTHH